MKRPSEILGELYQRGRGRPCSDCQFYSANGCLANDDELYLNALEGGCPVFEPKSGRQVDPKEKLTYVKDLGCAMALEEMVDIAEGRQPVTKMGGLILRRLYPFSSNLSRAMKFFDDLPESVCTFILESMLDESLEG